MYLEARDFSWIDGKDSLSARFNVQNMQHQHVVDLCVLLLVNIEDGSLPIGGSIHVVVCLRSRPLRLFRVSEFVGIERLQACGHGTLVLGPNVSTEAYDSHY